MPTSTINPKIEQTPGHAPIHVDNNNIVYQYVYLLHCSDHIIDFDVIDDFYDLRIKDLPPEKNDDNIKVDAEELVLPTTPTLQEAQSLNDDPTLSLKCPSQTDQTEPFGQ